MAEDPKANNVGEKCEKEFKEMGDKCKEVMDKCKEVTLSETKGICPRRPERSRNLRNLRETLVKPWWNFGETLNLVEGMRDHETWRNLVEPWWKLGGTLRGREPETPRNLEHHGGTLVELGGTFRRTFWQPKTDLTQTARDTTKLGEPWWNLSETLVEPFAELWWNLPRDLLTAQDGSDPEKKFCPETFTMADDPKVIAVGEKI